MSDVTSLDDIEISGIDEYPETDSVLLHGPPGTGKTTAAAARVALLLRDHGYDLHDATWATYRRSLAEDTLNRLVEWGVIDDGELGKPTEGATRYISTIHAVANRVVGGLPEPIEHWRPARFCNIQDIRYATNRPWDRSPGQELFRCFQWMAENCYDPTNSAELQHYPYLETLRQQFPGDIGEIWEAWERYKDENNRIDFHKQLEAAIDQGVTPGTDILVIDEYHDATPLIARVAELWMQDSEIVIVAGDPHQVVNQYQGADPYFFKRLEDRYPKVLLDKSYRVGGTHWRAATSLIARAHEPPAVTPTGGAEIREYRSSTFAHSDETGWRTPPKTQAGSPAALASKYDDMMFLTRTRGQADGVGAALEKEGILYRSQKDLGGWNTDRGERRLHLYNAFTKIRGISPDDFDGEGCVGLGRFEGGERTPGDIYLSAAEADALLRHTRSTTHTVSRGQMKEICEMIRESGESQSLMDINEYVDRSFWGTYTHGASSERELIQGRRRGNVDRKRRALRKALQNHDEPIDPAEISVSVMTIHASKGQEATDVVVYDGVTSRVKKGMNTDEGIRKNEWRTWYVALTRASERLHIICDAFNWTHQIIPSDLYMIAAPRDHEHEVQQEQEASDD